MNTYRWSFLWLIAAAMVLCGCGEGGGETAQDKNFYTSGNREADQRADQRMAQQEQLTGGTNDGGQTTSKTKAVISTDKKSLYDRLGGEANLTPMVDDFVTRALADPRVNLTRVGVKRGGLTIHRDNSMTWEASPDNVAKLKLYMVQFLSLATGGPSKYEGEDIATVAKNMHFSNPEFDAAVGDLKATLDKMQISNQEQKELLSVVESTREQIVTER